MIQIKRVTTNLATGQEKRVSANLATGQVMRVTVVFDILNTFIDISILDSYLLTSAIVDSELLQKRTLTYFNSKTFADIQGKEMQEIVYEVVG